MPYNVKVQEKLERADADKLNCIIIGAGLGGLAAGIGLLLAGHNVHILEGASQIGEIGAGIQVLPNSSRCLIQFGLEAKLAPYATSPSRANMLGWKGEKITSMDFEAATDEYGTPFWDFHRADLHRALLERAGELGAEFEINARVVDVEFDEQGDGTATAVLADGRRRTADLIVGADGLHSRCREILLGKPSPPTPTGDLAYRLLLDTKEMREDEEIAPFLDGHEVRYWMGPGAHAVNYVLRNGSLFNMVLLVPDDMPAGATTLAGNVEEMRAFFKDWDPRITKCLNLCQSVQKWKLCYRPGLETSWSHPSGTFTLLGDAVHATLPYLASGAGMSIEDGATLGLCLGRIKGRSAAEKKLALAVYEACRRERTESIVERGNIQQVLYHLDDGEEQRARDERFRGFGEVEEKIREAGGGGDDVVLPEGLVEGADPLVWRRNGVGKWLLRFDCQDDVDAHWPKETPGAEAPRAQL